MVLNASSSRAARIRKVQARMAAEGIDVLVVPSPANMHYLSGFDGWSFYLDQCLLLAVDRPGPVWIGRSSDRHAVLAGGTVSASDIFAYGDEYLQSDTCHPYDFVADRIVEHGWARARIGVPMGSYQFSAAAHAALTSGLPLASFVDDCGLIEWVRSVKDPEEVACMRRAGSIASQALLRGVETIRPGARTADTAAAVLSALTAPDATRVGNYPAIAPLVIDGLGPAQPHTTWSDRRYADQSMTILELAGVYGRYHCPLARTICQGPVRQEWRDAAEAQIDCLQILEQIMVPGVRCGDLAQTCAQALARHGFHKAGRFGYSTGLAYPPDWGEHTISVRQGEDTRIQEGMTLFFIPAIWGDQWSVAIGDTFHVTSAGGRRLADLPRALIEI